MKRSGVNVVVWDGDNTIWDWMGFAVPAYTAMRDAITILARKSSEETSEAMKAFYAQKGSVESEGLVQGLHQAGFFNSNSEFNVAQAAKEIQQLFSTVRRKHLKLYPAIADTVQRIHDLGCLQVVLTDAPGNQAAARLKHFRLSPYFDEVYAMQSAELPEHAPTEGFVHTSYVVDQEKPHSNLEAILGMTREGIARHVAIVGDNKVKDMGLADRYGALGVLAAYGHHPFTFIEPFLQFVPEPVAGRNVQLRTPIESGQAAQSRVATAQRPEQVFRLVFELGGA